MVRLEKLVYETVVNNAALGRNRVLTSPRKWHSANPYQHMRLWSYHFFNSWMGKLVSPFLTVFTNFEKKFQRDLLLQQGLSFEDKFLHTDAELRRCNFFEHIARSSLHPYHWILKMRKRDRYWKIQRVCRGFFVPDYVRNQAATQTEYDYLKLEREWFDFFHDNYGSDITPTARRTVIPKLIPLELLLNYGVLKNEAWNRYFFTERDKGFFSPEQLQIVSDRRRFPYDLTTSAGKKKFQEYVVSYNEKNPGLLAPEGQKFDFEAYYKEIGV